jgi:hypothetical protein
MNASLILRASTLVAFLILSLVSLRQGESGESEATSQWVAASEPYLAPMAVLLVVAGLLAFFARFYLAAIPVGITLSLFGAMTVAQVESMRGLIELWEKLTDRQMSDNLALESMMADPFTWCLVIATLALPVIRLINNRLIAAQVAPAPAPDLTTESE